MPNGFVGESRGATARFAEAVEGGPVDDLPAPSDPVQALTELRDLAVEHLLGVVAVLQEDLDDRERQLQRVEQ